MGGHAHLTTKRREPWLFGQNVTTLMRETIATRYQLLPMWYTLAFEWARFARPMIRPLWYHSLLDAKAYEHVDDQFLVGDSIVVSAITSPGVKKTTIYLPAGEW